MKKILFTAAILVVTGLILVPAYLGRLAERTLEERLANLPLTATVEVFNYRRGWLRSTARLRWSALQEDRTVQVPLPPGSPIRSGEIASGLAFVSAALGPIDTDIEITHGPVLFVEGAGFGLFHAKGQVDLPGADAHGGGGAEVSEPHYALLNVRFFMRGKVDSRLEVPRLVRETHGTQLRLHELLVDTNWSGTSAPENLYLAVKRFEMHTDAPGAGLSVALSQLRIDMEFPQGMASGALLPPVTTNTTLGEFVFSIAHDAPELRLSGLTARESIAREADGELSGRSETNVKSLSILGREFSPVELQAEFGGIGESDLMKFLAAASASAVTPPGSDSGAPETPATTASPRGEATNRALYDLLTGNPFFDLKVDTKFRGKDEIKLDMHLGIDGTRAPAASALADDAYPLALFAGLECSLGLSFPVAAADELLAADVVPMLMMQGVLKQDDSTYLVRADIRDGVLTLNGQPIPLPGTIAVPAPNPQG